LFELAGGAGKDDLPNHRGNSITDAGEGGEIRIFTDEVVYAFREGPDLRGGTLIGFDLVRIFLLRRKQLRQTRETVRDLGIAEHGEVRGLGSRGVFHFPMPIMGTVRRGWSPPQARYRRQASALTGTSI